MDLVIKPTNRCNFDCTFCAASKVKCADLTEKDTIFFIKEYINPSGNNTIILNGGDPLMMPPSYYQSIINWLNENSISCSISFTTNLWDFYINPKKWEKIFTNSRVRVITSFQYDDKRRLANGNVFSDSLFKQVQSLFYNKIGYKLDFISVLNKDNLHTSEKLIALAKELGVMCKLNSEVQSGKGRYFLWADALCLYYNFMKRGLETVEYNTLQVKNTLLHKKTVCPFCRNCQNGIICMGPNKKIHRCPSLNDDQWNHNYYKDRWSNLIMKTECLNCSLFFLCNGCKKIVQDTLTNKMQDIHCAKVKNVYKDYLC